MVLDVLVPADVHAPQVWSVDFLDRYSYEVADVAADQDRSISPFASPDIALGLLMLPTLRLLALTELLESVCVGTPVAEPVLV